jgi:hypothetical protein
MKHKITKYFRAAIALLVIGHGGLSLAQNKPEAISGPFGSKAIQLSIGSGGITRKEGGYICDLDATLGGGHYSEWGETEKDAQTIVMKTCSNKSGLLLCKKDKVTCREDK